MRTIFTFLIALLLYNTLLFAQYPRYQKISAAEYFINTDPGEGNGTAISGQFDFWEVPLNVNNINISNGSRLYVRAKSTNGKWSAPVGILKKDHFTSRGATLQYGEYFINSDPGKGHGTPINIGTGVFTLGNLRPKQGDKIFFRVKDSFNRWSEARPVIYRYKNISKSEYYVKLFIGGTTQPSAMQMLSIFDSSGVFASEVLGIPHSLQDTFFVRFQSDDKFWSRWTKGPLVDPTSVKWTDNLPTEFNLFQNYPNPFNPVTTIKYSIPTFKFVTLKVFDMLGREITFLVNEEKSIGNYEVKFDGGNFSSGVYFYRLSAGNFVQTKKFLLLK